MEVEGLTSTSLKDNHVIAEDGKSREESKSLENGCHNGTVETTSNGYHTINGTGTPHEKPNKHDDLTIDQIHDDVTTEPKIQNDVTKDHDAKREDGASENDIIDDALTLSDVIIDDVTSDRVTKEIIITKALHGDIDVIYPENVREVRVFMSSTFTDTFVERNTLMVKVYPRIKTFCQERGYDFQIVDMRWGVRDEATDDHMTSELCMKELEVCQKLSTGPNFVTLLGQKYGYRPFPPKIPANDFERLLGALDNKDDITLLERWFLLDENTVPPHFHLQPITALLPDYRNYGDRELRKKASITWWDNFERMQIALRKAADQVFEKQEDKQKYFMSVTEDEIRRGIIEIKTPEKHTLWFKRVFSNLEDHVHDVTSGKFIDVISGDQSSGEIVVNSESQQLLKNLREKDLKSSLPVESIVEYDVGWHSNGINISLPEHAQYIQKLCNDVYNKLTSLISASIDEEQRYGVRDPLLQEVIQHLSFCQKKCLAFHGRGEFLEFVKTQLLGNGKNVVVIYGESGCGKTSLVAKVTSKVKTWFVQPLTMVCRFIGTTPGSSSIRALLRSVCLQLGAAGLTENTPPEDLQALIDYFPECLKTASSKSTIVLIFDSLDQLSIEDGGRTLDWLPSDLPANVYFVLSSLPGAQYQCFPRLKAIYPEDCLLQVPSLAAEESADILDSWLRGAQRTLRTEQRNEVLTSFQDCPLPLYLKLAFDESCRWKSYTPFKDWDLPPNIRDIISCLFDRVERIHGYTLVSHALGYITASKNGLTEAELEDLLSLDDEVLNDVFQYWTPPIRRLPPLLWKRIRYDINDYLIDRGADGARVTYWYHRQFIEVARDRYLGNKQQARQIHLKMAEYFLGTWSEGNPKPFVDKNGEHKTENRLVASQPLMFDKSDENPTFNLRKLSELPQHLFLAEDYTRMKDEVLFNFEFLLALLRATSLDNVLDNFEMFFKVFPQDADTDILQECLRLSTVALSIERKQLATQIIGRMMGFQEKTEEYPYICKVLKEAYNSSVPCFIPNQNCLISPGGMVRFAMPLESLGECRPSYSLSMAKDDRTLILSWTTAKSLEIRIIDHVLGKVLRKFTLTSPKSLLKVNKNQISDVDMNHVLLAGGNVILIFHLENGKVIQEFLVDECETFSYENKTPVCFADDDKLLVALTNSTLRVWDMANGKVLHDIAMEVSDPMEHDHNLENILILHTKGRFAVYRFRNDWFTNLVDLYEGKILRKFRLGDFLDMKLVAQDSLIVLHSGSVYIYNTETGAESAKISYWDDLYLDGNKQLVVSDSGAEAVFTYSVDQILVICDLESESCRQIEGVGRFVEFCSRNGNNVIAIGKDDILRKYDTRRKKESTRDEGFLHFNFSVKQAPDNRHVIVVDGKTVSIWDMLAGEKVRTIIGKCNFGRFQVLSRDCKRGVYFLEKRRMHGVLNLITGGLEATFENEGSLSHFVGMVDKNHLLHLRRCRRSLELIDIRTGEGEDCLSFSTQTIEIPLLSFDGSTAILPLTDDSIPTNFPRTLVVLNTSSMIHRVIERKPSPKSIAHACGISYDGKYLLSRHDDQYLIWNLSEVKVIHEISVTLDGPWEIKTSSDSYHMIMISQQPIFQIWDMETGNRLYEVSLQYMLVSDQYITVLSFDEIISIQSRNTVVAIDRASAKVLAAVTLDNKLNDVCFQGNTVAGILPCHKRVVVFASLQMPERNQMSPLEPSVFDGIPVETRQSDSEDYSDDQETFYIM